MEIPDNAKFVCLSFNLLDQLFSEWRNHGKAEMLLWFLLLGFKLDDKRRVFVTLEDCNGGENDSADVKSFTEEEMSMQVWTSMYLRFWHLQSYQIWLDDPPKQVLQEEEAAEWGAQTLLPQLKVRVKEGKFIYLQRIIVWVLHMRRLGGACAVALFMTDNPLQLIEPNDISRTKPKKFSNKVTEKRISKLMEDNIRADPKTLFKMLVSFLSITRLQVHSSESSSLKLPEPNAPS